MKSVGIKVLKNKLSEYVRLASQGETILICDRDDVVAELSPVNATRARSIPDAILADAIRSGLVTPALLASGRPAEAEKVAPLRELLELLKDDREDR